MAKLSKSVQNRIVAEISEKFAAAIDGTIALETTVGTIEYQAAHRDRSPRDPVRAFVEAVFANPYRAAEAWNYVELAFQKGNYEWVEAYLARLYAFYHAGVLRGEVGL